MYVRSDHFLIARTTTTCPRCAASTEVIALVLPPGHETDEADETDVDRQSGADELERHWIPAQHTAFLFLVDQVSRAAGAWLRAAAKQYAQDCGEGQEPGLRNRCVWCGVTLDDQDLFCEPGGAFLPTSDAEAGRVSLQTVDQPIQATVDGYAYEPEFFKAMLRA